MERVVDVSPEAINHSQPPFFAGGKLSHLETDHLQMHPASRFRSFEAYTTELHDLHDLSTVAHVAIYLLFRRVLRQRWHICKKPFLTAGAGSLTQHGLHAVRFFSSSGYICLVLTSVRIY